jgi:hypothetical protein
MNNEVLSNTEPESQHLGFEIPVEVHQLPFGYTSGILYLQYEKKPLTSSNTLLTLISTLIPVIFLLGIIVFQSRAYLFWYLLPRFEKSLNYEFGLNSSSALLLVFTILSIVLLFSTLATVLTPPGEVDSEFKLESDNLRNNIYQVSISERMIEKIEKLGSNERKRTLFPRFCRTCSKIKPDRSHHCSVCNTCVLRMDHHCPYVANCIGMMNYKYFMNMILSGMMNCLIITGTMWEGVKETWESKDFEMDFKVLIGISYFSNLVFTIVLIAFCCFHFYLIGSGLTTIEFREKMTVKFESSPYDQGCIKNFIQVFGKNPIFWCIPIPVHQSTEQSLTFNKNDGWVN